MSKQFLHDLYNSDLYRICEMVDVELAWECFKLLSFSSLTNMPPWGDIESVERTTCGLMKTQQILYLISYVSLQRQRDSAWSMAKQCNNPGITIGHCEISVQS